MNGEVAAQDGGHILLRSYLTCFIVSILQVLHTPLISVYALSIGASLLEIGLVCGLSPVIYTIFAAFAGFFLQRIVSGILSYYSQLLDKERLIPLNKELIPLVQRGAKIVIWVLALLIILPLFGINISGLIATLGVSSLAIALAAQDTIANIISGFMIMVDRPFRIGDRIKLPSGEVRMIHLDCRATVGQVSNIEHNSISLGKAGRRRWLGRRPHTRGVAMNPVDHPHGGGEGKAGQGNPHPVSPWGWHTKGKKTRKRKPSDKYILKRRKE